MLCASIYDMMVLAYIVPKLFGLSYLVPYGLVLTIFIQSYIIAKSSAKAYKTVEKLSKDLEKEVLKKTNQIEIQYKDFKTLLFNLEQGFWFLIEMVLLKGNPQKLQKIFFK